MKSSVQAIMTVLRYAEIVWIGLIIFILKDGFHTPAIRANMVPTLAVVASIICAVLAKRAIINMRYTITITANLPYPIMKAFEIDATSFQTAISRSIKNYRKYLKERNGGKRRRIVALTVKAVRA